MFEPRLQITDYLYLGGEESTSDKAFLADHCGVTHVLNCTTECPLHYPDDFRYLRIAVTDDVKESLVPYFRQAHEFIEDARGSGGNVLVWILCLPALWLCGPRIVALVAV